MLAALTALVVDVAQQIGCFTGVRDSVIANTVLALGTSIPGGVSIAHDAERKGLEKASVTAERDSFLLQGDPEGFHPETKLAGLV